MMEHYTHDNWTMWLDHLCSPFSEIPCGEDLKYEEDFKYLKSSFSGISELNCKAIFITGTKLLSEKSKDLRIVSYVLFGAASEYGVEGLVNGLTLLNRFVEQFWTEVHPVKEKARKAVHTWLLSQQSRIVALAEQQGHFDGEQIVKLQQQLALYSNVTVRQIDSDAGPLSELVAWAEKLHKKYPISTPEPAVEKVNEALSETVSEGLNKTTAANVQASEAASVTPAQKTVNGSTQAIDTDTQFTAVLRQLLSFDKGNNNLARLVALSRAARWSDIKLPPNEQGKTRIPAPRSTAFSPMLNALANDDYLNAFMQGEALFMEGALHFNLDLQVMQLNALKGLGKMTVVSQLEFLLYQLNSRFPQLSQLTYEDGSALCSAKTKDVITDIAAQFSQTNASASADNDAFEQVESKAKTYVEQGKLESALAIINELCTSNAYGRAQLLLMRAKMCLLAERYDFAKPMLVELINTVDKHQLGQWQPSLCMQIWRSAVLCFDTLAAKGDDDLAEQAQALRQKMILTQPEVALGWI